MASSRSGDTTPLLGTVQYASQYVRREFALGYRQISQKVADDATPSQIPPDYETMVARAGWLAERPQGRRAPTAADAASTRADAPRKRLCSACCALAVAPSASALPRSDPANLSLSVAPSPPAPLSSTSSPRPSPVADALAWPIARSQSRHPRALRMRIKE